jgi:eukaryotic-like serine/threonine-protein kinase
MPLRPLAIGIALVALALALWLLIAAVRRRRWTSLLQVVPALGLLALVALLVPYIFGLNAPHPFFNRPAAVPAGTVVYYQSGPNGTDARVTLFAVDGQTGKSLWQRPMSSTAGFEMQITPAESAVYVATHSFQPDQSSVSHVLALDGATGSVLWQRTLPGSYYPSVPLLAENTLFLGLAVGSSSPTQQLVALRPSDGATLWSIQVGATVANAPRLFASSGVIYVQLSNSDFQARRLADGKLLWTSNHSRAIQGLIVAGPDAVYDLVSFGGTAAYSSATITAYSAQTGAQLWQYVRNDFFNAAAFADDIVYVSAQHAGINGNSDSSGHLTNPETLYALDAATGQLRWTYATHSVNSGSLAAGPGIVYISGDDGIHALRAADGSLLWHSDPHMNWGFSRRTPIVGSTLYVTAVQYLPPENLALFLAAKGQGYLYAVSATDGSADWGVALGPVLTIYGKLPT